MSLTPFQKVVALVAGVLLVAVILVQTYKAGQRNPLGASGGEMLTAAYEKGFQVCQEQF